MFDWLEEFTLKIIIVSVAVMAVVATTAESASYFKTDKFIRQVQLVGPELKQAAMDRGVVADPAAIGEEHKLRVRLVTANTPTKVVLAQSIDEFYCDAGRVLNSTELQALQGKALDAAFELLPTANLPTCSISKAVKDILG